MRRPSPSPVVVGVTGTSAGLAAVRLAAREALSRGRELRIVHAFTWPNARLPANLDYDRARRAASRVVDEAIATAQRSTPGVRVTGQLVDGLPDRVLLRLGRTAELLVVGDDDLATTPWLPEMSVLVQAVSRAWCPVMVARGPRPPAGPILVAVDGSTHSLVALKHAATEAVRHQVPVHVAHVAHTAAGGPGAEVLDRAVRAVPELGDHETHLLSGAPGPTLVRQSCHARMLVLGHRGSDGAGLIGSVAREVLHHAACPTVFPHGRPLPAQRVPRGTAQMGNALAR
ncbi:universal stress protein UspA [Paractinoplanes deccanensis]|uniref:Universal stress protein UspA n=1 Tax=Paractinoplanes deccanensis TaxID=113561 RepID=A0ABQ3YLP6_9ACTN|nr:universal stress protein [Actinoplanes deccanensis]GID80927.1 universal stress protein UspA [Actinoplanes deccanensis]